MPDLGQHPDFLRSGDMDEEPDHRELSENLSGGVTRPGLVGTELEGLAARLDLDPDECQRAVEGLEALDNHSRCRIIQELGTLPRGAGVASLLQLLAESTCSETQNAARAVLDAHAGLPRTAQLSTNTTPAVQGKGLLASVQIDSLVTPVNGDGRATIALTVTTDASTRTALFFCDMGSGITGAIGEHQKEPGAGELLAQLRLQTGEVVTSGETPLALGLLAGCLWLCGTEPPASVKHWINETLGPGFQPRRHEIASSSLPEDWSSPGSAGSLRRRADELLAELPDWLDRSPLTFELAEEIVLREGRKQSNPLRDAGAFRYLFEHRLLSRLELYRRMLLWMGRCWEFRGKHQLSRSGYLFAAQLADEQFAVPGHPFAEALSARSINAAIEQLGTNDDPRKSDTSG